MASELLANPTATGLLGGLAVVLFQFVWKRVMGTDQKSIPLTLAEINTKLAGIDTTLQLMHKDAEYDRKAFNELKDDFYKHMEKYHGAPPQPVVYKPRPSDSQC